ncbi:MAG: tetratricopeptide repeat protein, partial [Nitrospinota bacterium]
MKHAFFNVLMSLILICTTGLVFGEEELPVHLPKSEGSKNFDLEISIANEKGIRLFWSEKFDAALEYFVKAQSLAKQFRDPGLGVVSFNLGLTLHKLNLHEDAVEVFATAKKYARGNRLILDSNLIRFHECGFNPSIPCKEQPPEN